MGRASSNDIIVNGLGVADHHAKIIYDADNFAATVVPHTHAVLVISFNVIVPILILFYYILIDFVLLTKSINFVSERILFVSKIITTLVYVHLKKCIPAKQLLMFCYKKVAIG